MDELGEKCGQGCMEGMAGFAVRADSPNTTDSGRRRKTTKTHRWWVIM